MLALLPGYYCKCYSQTNHHHSPRIQSFFPPPLPLDSFIDTTTPRPRAGRNKLACVLGAEKEPTTPRASDRQRQSQRQRERLRPPETRPFVFRVVAFRVQFELLSSTTSGRTVAVNQSLVGRPRPDQSRAQGGLINYMPMRRRPGRRGTRSTRPAGEL